MGSAAVGRASDRAGFTDNVRLRLLEDDADELHAAVTSMNDRLGKILWAVVGVLISVTTSAVLLALSLGVSR